MSANVLKWIAMISMLIDHIGAVFGPWMNPEVYTLLRALGRTAFPLYAFMLVEGAVHTKNAPKYLMRLLLFAAISEIPFDLAFYQQGESFLYWGHQNIFVTLAIGLMTITALEKLRKTMGTPAMQTLLFALISLLACLVVEFCHGDYGSLGIALILLLYFVRGYRWGAPVALLAWLAYYDWSTGDVMELYGAAAAVFIGLYNGRKGESRLPKWFFYGFYPAHILVLLLLRNTRMG